MSILQGLAALVRRQRIRVERELLAQRIQFRNPTLVSNPTAVWNYGWDEVDAIELGLHVAVGAHAEIVVRKRSIYSPVPGRLVLADSVGIGAGSNIRAAGGTIRIGRHTAISQHCVLVAANHTVAHGQLYTQSPWDQSRTGIDIGDNVWVSAKCVILPGITIGSNSVIAAGSVVTRSVPANEIWGGVPARRLKDVPGPAAASATIAALA